MKITSIFISAMLIVLTVGILVVTFTKGPELYLGIHSTDRESLIFPNRDNVAVIVYYSQVPYYLQEKNIFVRERIGRNPFYYPLRQKLIYGGTKPM